MPLSWKSFGNCPSWLFGWKETHRFKNQLTRRKKWSSLIRRLDFWSIWLMWCLNDLFKCDTKKCFRPVFLLIRWLGWCFDFFNTTISQSKNWEVLNRFFLLGADYILIKFDDDVCNAMVEQISNYKEVQVLNAARCSDFILLLCFFLISLSLCLRIASFNRSLAICITADFM